MICMLFCGVMFWQAGGLSYADQTAVVATEKGDPLNMRAGVGTGTAVLTVIPNGSQVTVLDTAAGSDANGTWNKITYNGLCGGQIYFFYSGAIFLSVGGNYSANFCANTGSSAGKSNSLPDADHI